MKNTKVDIDKVPATAEELRDLAKTHREWIDRCLADQTHTSWTPTIAVLCRSDPFCEGTNKIVMVVLNVPFNEDDEKHLAMTNVGRKLFDDRIIPAGAIFSSEAWMSRHDPNEPRREPRHAANRREVIIVLGSSFDGQQVCCQNLPITRGDGHRMIPGEWQLREAGRIQPRLLAKMWIGYMEACREHMNGVVSNGG
jgi:hypothetical protein